MTACQDACMEGPGPLYLVSLLHPSLACTLQKKQIDTLANITCAMSCKAAAAVWQQTPYTTQGSPPHLLSPGVCNTP